uniref:N-acetylglucosamine-1-phosphotransferase subunits alpha/beta-like n=1 Tax=Dermatophagoides pteronyssinus TaxID=6956 RepID=A0A6P6Y2S3_DERPT|nr:N-acetylglucosamine-1-phosphotransferase subunits alpha/beta-like [Dermatophagoides pteronyssinus]
MKNVIRFEHDNTLSDNNNNSNYTILFFSDIKYVREFYSDCIRIIDGTIYKFSPTFIMSTNDQNNSTIKLDSLLMLRTKITSLNNQQNHDPLFKYLDFIERSDFQFLNLSLNENLTKIYLYTKLNPKINITNIITKLKSLTDFELHYPINLQITDHLFFKRQLQTNENIAKNRFFDNDELKYSLRSLHQYAPWIRYIYIVTNGQIPNWLNLEHPKIRIITHQEIFVNQSHLPTFSSSAIESHIHRIKNLSKYFLYFNDDIILGKSIFLDDFFTKSRGFRIYLSWPVPNCASGCPLNWLNDGFCDKACNSSRCLWDGGDCLNNTTMQTQTQQSNNNEINQKSNVRPFYCATNCITNWLGDSSCDQVCNNTDCAFDMADCGVDNFQQFYQIIIEIDKYEYYYPSNASIIYLNFTKLNDYRYDSRSFPIKIIDISYNVSFIHSAVLNEHYRILTLMFEQNIVKGDLNLNLTASFRKKIFNFNIFIHCDVMITKTLINYTSSSPSFFNLSLMINEEKLRYSNILEERKRRRYSKHHSTISCGNDLQDISDEISWKFHKIDNHQGFDYEQKKFYSKVKSLYHQLICDANSNLNEMKEKLSEYFQKNSDEFVRFRSRKLLDAYADSLIYVNHIYNKEFGIEVRKVPAHMAHFMDRDIMFRLHDRFGDEFEKTSSHKIRNSFDMQLAFAYYYFLMSETKDVSFEQIITSYDIDHSGTLNRNELQTLALQIYHRNNASNELQNHLKECCTSCDWINDTQSMNSINLNIEILQKCSSLMEHVVNKFGRIKVNKYEIINDDDVAFKMLRSNRTLLEMELDELRIKRKKFICLNDNFDHDNHDIKEKKELNNILNNFYLSLFPYPSPFELNEHFQNPFLHIDQYRKWNLLTGIYFLFF